MQDCLPVFPAQDGNDFPSDKTNATGHCTPQESLVGSGSALKLKLTRLSSFRLFAFGFPSLQDSIHLSDQFTQLRIGLEPAFIARLSQLEGDFGVSR